MATELKNLVSSLRKQRSAIRQTFNSLEIHEGSWLVDYPNHLNAGDHAIWLGEQVMLQPGLGGVAPSGHERIPASSSDILLHGGGNLGSLYPERMRIKIKTVENAGARRVIHLPQSIHLYEGHSFPTTLIRNQDVFLVRDWESYELLDPLGVDVRMCPDPAVLLELPIAPPGKVNLRRNDIESETTLEKRDWLSLREWMRESPLDALALFRVLRPHGAKLEWLNRTSHRILMKNLQLRLAGDKVQTDRLHASILAGLQGSQVWIESQRYDKLHRYWRAWGGL